MKFKSILSLALLCLTAGNAMAMQPNLPDAEYTFSSIDSLPIDSATVKINLLINRANSAQKILQLADNAESTLGNPASEAHNEILYIKVLEAIANSPKLSDDDKIRPSLLLENALKNQIGTTATDIRYQLPDGSQLSILADSTQFTLVYFNDPDCDACHKVKNNIAHSEILNSLCEQGILKIIGIYPYTNTTLWKIQDFPSIVENGWNYDHEIDDNGSYELPTMPLFYLLDANKTIILKNEPSLRKVEKTLNSLLSAK